MNILKKLYKKITEYMKPKCPNCKTNLIETIWIDNTVELNCEICKYHKKYNDSYP